jgi:hypothetical protein
MRSRHSTALSLTTQMKLLTAFFIVAAAAAAIWFVLVPRQAAQQRYRRRAVMTPNEMEFYGRIARALPSMHVCPQVAMHALIEPTSPDAKLRLIDFRRISQKVVDYAIFDAQWALVLVIELDDRTHVASRDAIRDGYMSAAGIRTLRYQSRSKPGVAQIAADVLGPREPAPAPAPSIQVAAIANG